jgi:hypothetical protein
VDEINLFLGGSQFYNILSIITNEPLKPSAFELDYQKCQKNSAAGRSG